MQHASEGGTHWYRRDGTTCYEIPKADGKGMKSPNITDARKLGLVPGFSGVSKILSAPGLVRWQIRQAILAALTLPKNPLESEFDYLSRIDEDSRAHAKQRADEGTEIHKAIEQFLRGETYDTKWHSQVSATVKLLHELPEGLIGDFKTKQEFGDKRDNELFFDNHIMQLVAYKHGYLWDGAGCPQDFYALPAGKCIPELTFACPKGYGGRIDVFRKAATGAGMNNVCVSILISVDEPGLVKHKIWTADEEQRGLDMFDSALRLWQLKNRYDSSWR